MKAFISILIAIFLLTNTSFSYRTKGSGRGSSYRSSSKSYKSTTFKTTKATTKKESKSTTKSKGNKFGGGQGLGKEKYEGKDVKLDENNKKYILNDNNEKVYLPTETKK